ncbi:MAG: GatB/YqeY domain-containing protein [Patescibacteria group bacterium]|nr:GatB/YqeY domain-containing protein [Patescibacteria group bacterium]
MPIRSEIEKKLKTAQKQKQEIVISTLRLVLAALKNYEIDHRSETIDDDTMVKILRRELNKRQESIEAFRRGGRNELADKEQQEVEIIKSFLPPEMTADEIRAVVQKVIDDKGGSAGVNYGQVMGETMKKIGSAAPGKVVSQVVKDIMGDSSKPKSL